MFHELRLSMEALAYSPKCPGFAKNIIYKVALYAYVCECEWFKIDIDIPIQGVAFISNLAPAMEAQQ